MESRLEPKLACADALARKMKMGLGFFVALSVGGGEGLGKKWASSEDSESFSQVKRNFLDMRLTILFYRC